MERRGNYPVLFQVVEYVNGDNCYTVYPHGTKHDSILDAQREYKEIRATGQRLDAIGMYAEGKDGPPPQLTWLADFDPDRLTVQSTAI